MSAMVFTPKLDIFSISQGKYLRSCAKWGNLTRLGPDEYYTFALYAENRSPGRQTWSEACVCVDGRKPWHWSQGELSVSGRGVFRIARDHMKTCMTPGDHTVVWYFDGKEVFRETFTFVKNPGPMDWASVFPFPSRWEIEARQRETKHRPPYLSGWLDIPSNIRFTEYMVDFRAGHLPRGTYCCLGTWSMDFADLKKRYRSVRTNGSIHAYAGFQKLSNGQTASIMSFWDIFCTDRAGVQRVHRPRICYPAKSINGSEFTGEGTGARCSVPFQWEANHWYRMHLKCILTGNTTYTEQWVQDLENGERQLLCRYDTGVANAAFTGSIAVFLECFDAGAAGEIRSMEIRKAVYREEKTGRWQAVSSVYLDADDGKGHAAMGLLPYVGSYHFGVTEDRIWMISSGAGGNYFTNGKGRKSQSFKIHV